MQTCAIVLFVREVIVTLILVVLAIFAMIIQVICLNWLALFWVQMHLVFFSAKLLRVSFAPLADTPLQRSSDATRYDCLQTT